MTTRLRDNQTGFGIVGILLILIVVAAIGGAGYYIVKHHKKTPISNVTIHKTIATPAVASPKDQQGNPLITNCPEWNYPSSDFDYFTIPWQNITTTTINLCVWGVSITVPQSMVGRGVYKFDRSEPGYSFSEHPIIDSSQCMNYLGSVNVTADGDVGYTRNNGNDLNQVRPPGGVILDQYYAAHKAANGNYVDVTQPSATNSTRFYSADNYYFSSTADYLIPSSVSPYITQDGLTTNCPGVNANDPQVFVDALATIKVN